MARMDAWLGRSPLFDRACSLESLTRAWVAVRAARGSAGIDDVTVGLFEAHWHAHLSDLAHALREESYLPFPARRFTQLKPNGDERPIGVLAVQDRIAQRSVHDTLEPLVERRFLPCSYAYRPGRNTAQAVAAVLRARAAGYVWAVDADVADFFPSLNHDRLLAAIDDIARDRKLVRLVKLWLAAGLLDPAAPLPAPERGTGRSVALLNLGLAQAAHWGIDHLGGRPGALPGLASSAPWSGDDPRAEGLRRTASGIALLALTSVDQLTPLVRRAVSSGRPALGIAVGGALSLAGIHAARHVIADRDDRASVLQGGVLSPLLSNVYMHPLDVALSRRHPHVVRYADNVLILCHSRRDAQESLDELRAALTPLRLRLNDDKTALRHVDEPFVFLGYRFADGTATPPAGQTVPAKLAARVHAAHSGVARHTRHAVPTIRSLGVSARGRFTSRTSPEPETEGGV